MVFFFFEQEVFGCWPKISCLLSPNKVCPGQSGYLSVRCGAKG